MAVCPNCGRETARTGDWACQWCGYPLLSKSFKKIPKTFRQVKKEKLDEMRPGMIEAMQSSLPPAEELLPPEPPVPETASDQIPEPAPTPFTEPETETEIPPESIPAPTTEPEPLHALKPDVVPESVIITSPEAVSEPEVGPAAEMEPAAPPIDLTVEELLSAYDREGTVADAGFADKTINLTGVVRRIEVKDTLDIFFIALSSADRNRLQDVRCIFDRAQGAGLMNLSIGQSVTVRGKYDGSIMDIRLKDCSLAG